MQGARSKQKFDDVQRGNCLLRGTSPDSTKDARLVSVAESRAYQQQEFQQPEHALPKIAILLCTYQGQQYLGDQLNSYAAQSYPNWKVWASDDGSQDNTQAILEAYRAKWGAAKLAIHAGPAKGFVANFLSLTCHADIQAEYYAYSDQDDIWEADKLQRAVSWLMRVPREVPALYCTRSRLVDAKNRDTGLSALFNATPGFANALIQSLAGGNTMVFNEAARELLRRAGAEVDVVSHDWWAYMLVSGCGGKVFYDTCPSIRYRQHEDNLVGMDASWTARLTRITRLFHDFYKNRNDRNLKAIQTMRFLLTPESRETLDRFAVARDQWLLPRVRGIVKSGVYCQTTYGNLSLFAATILKRI